MDSEPFHVLYPPLRALQEHLKEELARNPYLSPADPAAHGRDDDRPKSDDDRTDPPPPQDGPTSRPDGPG